MRYLPLLFLLIICTSANAQIRVKLPAGIADQPLDGRLLVMFSSNTDVEPRFNITDGP